MLILPGGFDPTRPRSAEWLRIYNGFGRQVAGRGNSLLSAETQHGTVVGSGLLIDTFATVSAGEVIPDISTGITVVMIAQKRGQISTSDFLFGEHLAGNGNYNYGFYESGSSGNLSFYVTASASAIAASGGTAWVAGAGPQVWVGTYGDGDNNVRFYLNGRQVGSIAQTGNITRTAGAFLRSCFWGNGTPNFIFLAGAVANRRLSAGEIAAKFPSPQQGMQALFAPRRIWVPVSAGGGATDLTAAEASHAHSADNVVLTSSTSLSIADALHAHSADSISLGLTGSESLVVADANHAHSAEALTLSTEWFLTVAEATHAHAADNLTLSVAGADTLAIADSTHAHTADALALTSASSLAIADATHAHTVDGLTLTAASVLTVQEALHAHAADNLTLSADNSTPLLIAEALHAHTSDGLSITVDAWLVVADSLHAHRADNVSISLPGQVASEASSTFQVLADYNVFFVAAYDRTFIVPRE